MVRRMKRIKIHPPDDARYVGCWDASH